MRRRCLAGTVHAASSAVFGRFTSMATPLALERHKIDLSRRGLVASRHDAVTFEAEQQRGKSLGEDPAAISPDASLPHGSIALAVECEPELVDAGALHLQHFGD
jgi:hypothetical protein